MITLKGRLVRGRIRASIVAVVLVAGCTADPGDQSDESNQADHPDSAVSSDRSGSAATPGPSGSPGTAWYARSVVLDLDGDSRPDSAVLTALGARSDDLGIALVLYVDGEVGHRERWRSGDELIDLDSATSIEPRRSAFMRAQLDSAITSVKVGPIDSATYRLVAEDTTTLRRVKPAPTQAVTFTYAYETTVALVWNQSAREFVRLYTCC